jgi:hypothetical protein
MACQEGRLPAEVLHRCYDLGDLLAVAAAGQAEAALIGAATRWLDRDALARMASTGLAVVGVAPAGDGERRLRQLGLRHVGSDADPPAALVGLARAALVAEPAAAEQPVEPLEPQAPPDAEGRRTLIAVWGPTGAPGRTTVAVNLAFEAAPLAGEVLLVDADTYGGTVAHANMQEHHRKHLGSDLGWRGMAGTAQPPLLSVVE